MRLLDCFDGIQPAGRTSISTDFDSQSEVSEEGYIMDMSLVAKLIDNFDAPGRKKGPKNVKDGHLSDFYASIRLDHMSTLKVRKLPTFLDIGNLGMYILLGVLLFPVMSLTSSLLSQSADAGSPLEARAEPQRVGLGQNV